MTYQFRFREEPFGLNSALDNAEELLSTDFAETWQGEVSRKSPDYVRWVQRSLNQILGLRLAVDGVIGRQTRSAVRRFQQQRGLKVDGIVGSQTESAFIAAGASSPPGGALVPRPATGLANPNVNVPLPRSGAGFYSYKPTSQQYGLPESIHALQAIASVRQKAYPQGPRIGIGDISVHGGGPMRGHKSHQKGVDVDIRLMRNDGREKPTEYQSPQYSRALTQELINLIRANGILGVRYIFFNDPRATGVKPWPNHDNHLHVRFVAPVALSSNELEGLPRGFLS
ncbi:MAG: penicillin-insensitive murein endopeptidase [Gammaproteobacteria bacterium]|nr:penicillin-insensitive murein endopeptidase [Gammaproteobacteria bacterium]